MEEQSYTELLIIQDTEKLLKKYGETEILYVTAEFEPFSNQQKPDLKFIPNNSTDKIFLIEFKFEPHYGFDENYFKTILDHKEFIQEDTDLVIQYAFGTNAMIDEKFKNYLTDNHIAVFSKIRNASELSDSIIEWTKSFL